MMKMIVVGGGAAGMMCAIKASDRYDVTLIEKNEKLGKKLFITGKGRCNLTNNTDEEEFLRNVVSNYKFLYSSIYSYNQSMVMEDFEKWGLRLKTERGNRVFPESDHSSDVLKTLQQELTRRRVKVMLNTAVTGLVLDEVEDGEAGSGKVKCVTGVRIGSKTLPADVVVLATGGLSYPQTGSDGDGLRFLEKLRGEDSQIKITDVSPALCPIVIREPFCKEMMGLSLRNVKTRAEYIPDEITKKNKKKLLYEEQGEMLFTHFGVTGPLMLSASSYIARFIRDLRGKDTKERVNDVNAFFREIGGKIIITVDMKPALTVEELDKRVIRDFDAFKNRELRNSLGELLPRLMIPVIIERSKIKPDKKVNAITQEERMRLVNLLKEFTMEVVGMRGFSEAIITSGGIDVKSIDAGTMEIKGVKGLRAAGEIIDVDALTGGFNLQIAWSTACLAAN